MYSPGEKDKLVISVLDTGVGIKAEDKKQLFKMFACLTNTRQMNTHGIGLGLFISKNIVNQFGGEIFCES